jgi:hypothetical protein
MLYWDSLPLTFFLNIMKHNSPTFLRKKDLKTIQVTLTCCFPSIAVKKVNVITFLPSLRLRDANSSDVGVSDCTFRSILLVLDLLLSLSASLTGVDKEVSTMLSQTGSTVLIVLVRLKLNGQILQLPRGAKLVYLSPPLSYLGVQKLLH